MNTSIKIWIGIIILIIVGGTIIYELDGNLNGRTDELNTNWDYKEYETETDYWYNHGNGLTYEEFISCEQITCECAKDTQTPCALFCIRCKDVNDMEEAP